MVRRQRGAGAACRRGLRHQPRERRGVQLARDRGPASAARLRAQLGPLRRRGRARRRHHLHGLRHGPARAHPLGLRADPGAAALRAGDLRQRRAQPRVGLQLSRRRGQVVAARPLEAGAERPQGGLSTVLRMGPRARGDPLRRRGGERAVVAFRTARSRHPLCLRTPREPRAAGRRAARFARAPRADPRRRLRIRPRAAAAARERRDARRGRRSDRGAAASRRRACSGAGPAGDHAAGAEPARGPPAGDRGTPAAGQGGGAGREADPARDDRPEPPHRGARARPRGRVDTPSPSSAISHPGSARRRRGSR